MSIDFKKMTAKELLEIARGAEDDIADSLDLLKRAEERATRITSIINDMPKSPNKGAGGHEAAMTEFIDLKGKITEAIRDYELIQLMSMKLIDAISKADYRRLLMYRYLDNMTWTEIAGKIGYSERNTHRLKDKALEEAEIVWEKVKNCHTLS